MRVKILTSNNPILQLALEEIAENLPKTPDFAILSMCPCYPQTDIPRCITNILKINNYIAFNAVDAFGNTKIVNEGVVGIFFYFEGNTSVDLFYRSNIPQKNFSNLLEETTRFLKEKENQLNVIIGDYANRIFPVFLTRLSENLQKNNVEAKSVCGGIVSTPVINGTPQPGYIFANGETISEGFVITSFSNLEFKIALSTGIFKRGPTYTITSASMFEIYELDGEPVSELIERLVHNIPNFKKEYLWYTPLAILNEREEIIALRTIKNFSETKVETWTPIEEGQKLKIAFVVPQEIIKDVQKVAKKVKLKMPYVEAIFNFSCVARQYTLGKLAKLEPKTYAQTLNAPLFGFFTYGEIAPSNGLLKLHNQTSVLVAMKEKENEGKNNSPIAN